MSRYVALLRGLNVGGHRVKMGRLRGLFEDLGFAEVSTVLASGNVLFSVQSDDAEGLRAVIEEQLERQLGYEVITFVRTPAELAAITALDPSGPSVPTGSQAAHYVIFLHHTAPESLRVELESLSSETDLFHFHGREVHWLLAGKLSESPLFGAAMDRATRGVANTMRNMNTVRRVVRQTGRPGN